MLKKCEELRVFDDPYVQNLNPFDEGFRKAIYDDNRECSGFLSTPSNQDTLHTPQIIPEFVARTVKDEISLNENPPMQDEPENLSTTPEIINNIPKITISEIFHEKPPPIPLLPKPSIIYAAPIITTTTSMHLTDGNKSNESVKDKLKNIILSSGTNSNSTSTSPDNNSKRLKLGEPETKLNLPAILIRTVPLLATSTNLIINNPTTITNSKIIKTEDVPKKLVTESTKKRTTSTTTTNSGALKGTAEKGERNRAAARRYRQKMKVQSQALREKYEKSQKEIAQLKKDITELKKLLLLHKDCDVTKKMMN